MLVCSVSQFRRRAAIAAGITEAATALDASTTGNIVFATLVDDPAAVTDRVDAYLGEIMLEAASAAATVNAGLIYNTAVVEQATALDLYSGTFVRTPIVADVSEAATAADTPDATITAAVAGRSAMLPGVFVNPSTSREGNVAGIQVNL